MSMIRGEICMLVSESTGAYPWHVVALSAISLTTKPSIKRLSCRVGISGAQFVVVKTFLVGGGRGWGANYRMYSYILHSTLLPFARQHFQDNFRCPWCIAGSHHIRIVIDFSSDRHYQHGETSEVFWLLSRRVPLRQNRTTGQYVYPF